MVLRTCMILVVLSMYAGIDRAHAQQEMHEAGQTIARMIVEDAELASGMTVRVEVSESAYHDQLQAGILQGFLESGMMVLHEDGGREAETRFMCIPRGVHGEVMKISVVGISQDEGRYIFSRAYTVPLTQSAMFEELLAPVIVISSAILAVYLLLTVRSS